MADATPKKTLANDYHVFTHDSEFLKQLNLLLVRGQNSGLRKIKYKTVTCSGDYFLMKMKHA